MAQGACTRRPERLKYRPEVAHFVFEALDHDGAIVRHDGRARAARKNTRGKVWHAPLSKPCASFSVSLARSMGISKSSRVSTPILPPADRAPGPPPRQNGIFPG